MSKTNTVIEINGKRYNAVSGQMLTTAPNASQPVKVIDGIVRTKFAASSSNITLPPRTATSRPSLAKVTATNKVSSSRHIDNAKAGKKRIPQNSQTLMRQAVHKPEASFKKSHKSQTRTDILARQPASLVQPKLSFYKVSAKREVHAQRVSQSQQITRFGSVVVPEHKHIRPATIDAKPHLNAVSTSRPPKEPVISAQRQPAADLFEKALLKANSHQQTYPKSISRRRSRKASRRLVNVSTLTLAALLLGGFFVYQNLANINLRMAASKAGFAAALPGYRPSGFTLGKIAYSTGNVTLHFRSNSDSNRSFALVEQPSNWDSTTLLNDYVNSAAGNSYQTASAAGRTIYLYGSGNATWVSGGVWYRVNNQNSLSTAQLVNMAASM